MSLAAKLKVGTKVKITAKGELAAKIGIVKYVGPLQGKEQDGDYVGLELPESIGKNNGTLNGVKYFETKQNFGAFLKPSGLSLINGTPVSSLAPSKSKAIGASKLSKQLQMDEPQQSPLQKELEEAKLKIKELQDTDWKKEIDELRGKLKQLEDENRNLKNEKDKIKWAVKEKDEGKEKELAGQIEFFKSQKEIIEKQKGELKKKIVELNEELETYAESQELIENLTNKSQSLELKIEGMKQELDAANAQVKNLKLMGNVSMNSGELQNQIKILNETVAILEGELADATSKCTALEEQIAKSGLKGAELKKLQLKLKSKEEEIKELTADLQNHSEGMAFVEQLTLKGLQKDEEITELSTKLNEYIAKVQGLEGEVAVNKELTEELNIELMNQEQFMDRYGKEIEEKNRHIAELSRQIEKYKKRIFDLTQNSESLINSKIEESREEEFIPKSLMGGFDQYQNKYYNSLKVNQNVRESLMRNQIQFSDIRNQVGVYMLNLNEALPESFTSKLYPEVIQTITAIKSANDKLYYIFETVVNTFKHKAEIYSKENVELCQWLIVLMKQVSMLYGSLHKLQFSLTTAESQEKISEVLAHRILRDVVRKVDNFALELLHKFADDNISTTIDFEMFTSSLESLDEINIQLKLDLSHEYDIKMRLCVEAMDTISTAFEMIINFKQKSELGENAEVDNLIENLIKTVMSYIYECCMNPYIRYKAEMKQYLEGLSLINHIFSDIRVEGNFHELGSLYSETENIAMLKDTILTTQFHVKELLNDLQDIIYPSALSKLQTKLPGKVWADRLKEIKDELLKVKQLTEEKKALEHSLSEAKKKIANLERDLKDRQNTKELHEKRIGELQIKLEQAGPLENENKRQQEKIRALEEANKIIEDEITEQSKKRKMLEEELKKVKERFDLLQTETVMRNKRSKANQVLSSEDVASLTIFKNSIKQSNTLRVLDLKKKVMQMKQSPIFNLKEKKEAGKQESNKVNIARMNALDQISKFEVTDPFSAKKSECPVSLEKILKDINEISMWREKNRKQSKGTMLEIGKLYVSSDPASKANLIESKQSIRIN